VCDGVWLSKIGPEKYALFSAKNNGRTFQGGAAIHAPLRYPDSVQQDVRAALFAWINFGGLVRYPARMRQSFLQTGGLSARTREELFKKRNEIKGSRLFLSESSFDERCRRERFGCNVPGLSPERVSWSDAQKTNGERWQRDPRSRTFAVAGTDSIRS
jgi:hypothetical protein